MFKYLFCYDFSLLLNCQKIIITNEIYPLRYVKLVFNINSMEQNVFDFEVKFRKYTCMYV
jgi:hypothetical protein